MLIRSALALGIFGIVLCTSSASGATSDLGSHTSIDGQQKQWHKVTLTFDGPYVSENDAINPFTNYRLDVTFTHLGSQRSLVVPGYFAADGDAADTGAVAGNKWRVEFAPDATGTWSYAVSFRTGSNVAVATASDAGTPVSFDGESGSFTVDATDKTGVDFRGKGRLQEVGQHYLQYLGTKEYFIKTGAGSPETLLAYADFDNTCAGKSILHHYLAHTSYFRAGDPTWRHGKGKGLIGGLNYLSSRGVNSMYFLVMNINGDGDNVWPYVTKTNLTRFDVSKLAQWEIVFSQMDKDGILLHMFTQEREDDHLLDGGSLGLERKLYYRELVARFSHHLGLIWNLGEENSNTTSQQLAFADYINALDPYSHLIAVHTWPSERDKVFTPLLGNPVLHGASLQLESPDIVHSETLKWVKKSEAAGDKWVVSVDEEGPASVGALPDANDPSHITMMRKVLWGSLLAGGGGVEWYFGYSYPNNDLNCEDWSRRDQLWKLSGYAADFMRKYMPLPLATNCDGITSNTSDYCFGKPGVAYAIYLANGGTTMVTLPAGEAYTVSWYNPRAGGNLQTGSVTSIPGGTASVGSPPSQGTSDWVVLLQRSKDGTTASGGSQPTGTSAESSPVASAGSDLPTVPAVTGLTLINSDTQADLRLLENNGTLSLSADGPDLNIRADSAGAVGSVVFMLDGKSVRTESTPPFALAGDSDGVYAPWFPAAGTHTLRAIPYEGPNGSGNAGTALEITFEVTLSAEIPSSQSTNDSTALSPQSDGGTNAPADPVAAGNEAVGAPGAPAVTGLTLINSDTQADLRLLRDNGTIALSTDGADLNIRAESAGAVGSVVFMLDGKSVRTESTPPFALAGDSDGVYAPWSPATGAHTLRAIPYDGPNGSGDAGTAFEITFTVTP